MRISYICKHCNHMIGELNKPEWSKSDVEHHLGLDRLNPVERNETIAYNGKHDVMYVQTVCDYCQSAMETNPELLIEGKLLQ